MRGEVRDLLVRRVDATSCGRHIAVQRRATSQDNEPEMVGESAAKRQKWEAPCTSEVSILMEFRESEITAQHTPLVTVSSAIQVVFVPCRRVRVAG